MRQIILHYVEPLRFHPRPFDRESCSFGSSYIARPWALIRDLWNELGSMLHRGLYGWSNSDTWSLDAHIARILPQMLRHLADHTHGAPMWMFDATGDDPTIPAAVDVHAVHTGSDITESSDGFTSWKSWLRHHAQAFDDWTRLMEDGWTGPLYPSDYWETTFRMQVKELGLEEAFNAPSPLDALSDDEKQAARHAWEEKVGEAKQRMHELIDHLDDLWD